MEKIIRKSEEVLTTTKEMVMNFYNAAKKNGDKVTLDMLNGLFGEANLRPKDITDNIKTFEDACVKLGTDHLYLREYMNFCDSFANAEMDKDYMAFLKLRIIVAALNEGWTPKFIKGEERWYPWFCLYSAAKIANYKDNGKQDFINDGGVLFGGHAISGATAGLVYACSGCVPSRASALIGSRLCLKSKALAEYCGRQFTSLWADFYCGLPQEKPNR